MITTAKERGVRVALGLGIVVIVVVAVRNIKDLICVLVTKLLHIAPIVQNRPSCAQNEE